VTLKFSYPSKHLLTQNQKISPLLSHGTLCFGAKDVMSFLGKKLRGQFLGEIVSYTKDGAWLPRVPGTWRVTDRGKQIMSASLCIRDIAFPELFHKNVA
jgi:hypothetical protein